MVTWGMASFDDTSFRTVIAQLADKLVQNPPASVQAAADEWINEAWPVFTGMQAFARLQQLNGNANRTPDQDEEWGMLSHGLVVGFCIGGYCLPDHCPKAYEIVFDPLGARPVPSEIAKNTHRWWGVPNIINRLIYGYDWNFRQAILSSGFWNGTDADFDSVAAQQALEHPVLPIREVVDFIHSCIRSTGKAMKFSNFPQVCGGAPEIALITTDRQFRWVRHKTWDTAIEDGG